MLCPCGPGVVSRPSARLATRDGCRSCSWTPRWCVTPSPHDSLEHSRLVSGSASAAGDAGRASTSSELSKGSDACRSCGHPDKRSRPHFHRSHAGTSETLGLLPDREIRTAHPCAACGATYRALGVSLGPGLSSLRRWHRLGAVAVCAGYSRGLC